MVALLLGHSELQLHADSECNRNIRDQAVCGLRPRCIMGEIQMSPRFDRDAVECTTHGGEVKTVNKAIQCIYSVRTPWNCAVLLPSFDSSLQEANKIEF